MKTVGQIDFEGYEPEDFARVLVDIEEKFGGSSMHATAFDGLVNDWLCLRERMEEIRTTSTDQRAIAIAAAALRKYVEERPRG